MINKVLYLGPQGSYSEIAKERFIQYFSSNCEFTPIDSIYKIMQALKRINSENLAAVIPIENSIEGVVRETQDCLTSLAEKGYRIQGETDLSIEHALISYGEKSQITVIKSHPQALAQCREYIYRNWNDKITLTPVLSTSSAVSSLSQNDKTIAAIGNQYCASLYNTPILDYKINDEDNNTTRFILLSKIKPIKTNSNKVSISFSTENKAGALNKVLTTLEKYGLNMSYIDSRPSRKELGEYVFYIDFAGYIEDTNVNMALIEIQAYVKMFEILSEGAEVL